MFGVKGDNFSSYLHSNEQGASFVESILVLPVIMFFALGIVELGRALGQYTVLVSIAEEGNRVASRFAGLEPGFLESEYDSNTDETATSSFSSENGITIPANHTKIRDRIVTLIKLNLDALDIRNIIVRTEYTEAGGLTDGDNLRIRIQANYIGMYGTLRTFIGTVGLDGLPIRAEAVGPYIDQDI